MEEQNNGYLPQKKTDGVIGNANIIEEINQDAKNDYKDKKRKRKITFAVLAVLSGIVLFCAIILITASVFFKIETVTVKGNTCYDEEFLLKTMGVEKGSSIFLANQEEYAKRVAGVCPMVYSVRVDKTYPDEIIIVITEETPSYRFQTDGIWSVVSKSGKVIYTGNDITAFEGWESLMEITPPPVLEAVMGYKIQYVDSGDGIAVSNVIDSIEQSPLCEKISFVKMESRFDIRLKYLDSFEILIGNKDDISVKLKFADKIISELKNGEKGTINVKNAKKGYAILE